jgi:hypothetical protein
MHVIVFVESTVLLALFCDPFFLRIAFCGFEFIMTRSDCESLFFANPNFCVAQKQHMHFQQVMEGIARWLP